VPRSSVFLSLLSPKPRAYGADLLLFEVLASLSPPRANESVRTYASRSSHTNRSRKSRCAASVKISSSAKFSRNVWYCSGVR